MSNVTLSIGGRNFTIACADGEETHIERLGRLIDEQVATAGASGQTESRMLLYASLLLADQVHELQDTVTGLPAGLHDRLARIAGQIENLANLLESEAPSA